MDRSAARVAALAVAILLFLPTRDVASSATRQDLASVFESLARVATFSGAVISPDGARVAWVESVARGSEVRACALNAVEKSARVTATGGSEQADEGSVAWSPDSTRLAFLSDAQSPGQLQLYVASRDGGAARKLTDVKGFLADPGWSPDGRTIAVLFTENALRSPGPLVAETARTGIIGETAREQRLALVDVESGAIRQISPGDMYVYEFSWSPDSRRLVLTAASGNGDNNWYIAQLYTIDASGGAMQSLYKPPLQVANPSWSPDGRSIAFIGGLMSDEGVTGGDIFVVPASGGEPKNITPGLEASVSWLGWAPGGESLLFTEAIDGDTGVATIDVATGRVGTVWRGAGQLRARGYVSSVSVATDGKTTAVVRDSLTTPPEVWAGPIGQWAAVTSRNRAVKPAWGEARSIHWSDDGLDVQGWLVSPRDFNPTRRYPMVVVVHGGPAGMAAAGWPSAGNFFLPLAADGYFVFEPNPRGSYGHGEAFTRANVKDFGYGDFRDVMTGIDQVLKEAPIDGQRIGITGWSYGGYMTMWAVTQTQRFKAAVAGAGIANFQSYYGQNEIDQWMIPYFGASVYDDPQVYARSSPITFIKQAKTPTLILVGDSDGECPAPQSFEFWHALHTFGVENEFVVYPHEGHSFANPAHLGDRVQRVAAWFDRYLKRR